MKNIHYQHIKIIALILLSSFISGCVGVAATGAATGAGVAYDRRTTGTIIEDETIELKAISALFEDKELGDQVHINVTSYNTMVLVTGEAPSVELRQRVIDKTRMIPKVSRVFNEIIVAAPSSLMSRSSDSLLTTKVKTKLLTSDQISAIHVKVVSENGVVYLMGIATHAEAKIAANISRVVGGVQKVVKVFEYSD